MGNPNKNNESAAQLSSLQDPRKLRPLGLRVLIKCEEDRSRVGSIELPENASSRELEVGGVGWVIRVSTGESLTWSVKDRRKYGNPQDLLAEVQPGDRVLFRKYLKYANALRDQVTGRWFFAGEQYTLIDVRDIIAVVDPDVRIGL